MKRLISIFFLFSTIYNLSFAAENIPKTDNLTQRVVITPVIQTISDFEKPVSSTMLSVEVIDPEDIQNSTATTFGELISHKTGVEASFSGGPGSLNSNFLRGQSSYNYVILIDGIKAQTDYNGFIKPYDIPLSQIYKIEVIKGNVSAIYGDAAIGGAINIITKQSLSKDNALGSVKYGSFGTKEVTGSVSKKFGTFDLTFGYANLETDGFNAIRGTQKPITYFNTDKDGFERKSYYTKISSPLTNKLSINASVNQSDSTLEQDNFYNNFLGIPSQSDANKSFYTFDSDNKEKRIALHYRPSPKSNFTTTYSISNLSYRNYRNGILNATMGAKASDGKQKALSFAFKAIIDGEKFSNVLSQKLEVIKNEYKDDYGAGKRNSSSFMLGAFFTDGTYNLNSNVRPERVEVTSGSSSSKTFNHLPYLIGFGRKIGEDYLLSASYSTSFRAPDANAYSSNPNIEPEVHETTEVSLKKESNDRYLRATLFSTRTSSAIYYDSSWDYFNIGRLQNRGLELSAKTSNSSVIDSDLSVTIQDPKSRPSSASLIKGDDSLKKRAKTYGSLQLSKKFTKSTLAAKIKYSSSKSDTGGKIQPALSVDSSFSMPIGQSSEMLIQAVNILNSDTQTTHAYNSAGRSFFLTLRGNLSFGY